MRPENCLRPTPSVFPPSFFRAADFFGLDRESQDALLALGKVWRQRDAARVAEGDRGVTRPNRFAVDCPAMKDWTKSPVRRTWSKVDLAQRDAQLAALDGIDYAKLEADTLAAILAQYPGATVECRIHDEWFINLPPAKKES